MEKREKYLVELLMIMVIVYGKESSNNSIWEDSETGSAQLGRKRKRAEEEDSEREQTKKRLFASEPEQWVEKEAE
eukprot:gene2491-2867_t